MKFKFVERVIFLFMCAVIALMCLVLTADAQEFIVRTVYFQPTDAPGPTREIFEIIRETQDFYSDEMARHGYGAKTFRHETDGMGNIGIRITKGRHKMDHYLDDTYNRVKSELHPGFFTEKEKDNVLVIIVGGIKRLSTGYRAFGGYFTGNKAGGMAVISGEALTFRVMAHEIGHTFSLNHANNPDAIMWTGLDILLDYEARWLDRHHFFNDTHLRNEQPRFVESLPIEAIENNSVRFKTVAESQNGLYQLQMSRKRGGFVIGTAVIEGKSATIEVDVGREELVNGDNVDIQIMDIHGNKNRKTVNNITLPDPLPEPEPEPEIIVEVEIPEEPDFEPEDPEVVAEVIIVDCPDCGTPKDEPDLSVHPHLLLTTQWGVLKQR